MASGWRRRERRWRRQLPGADVRLLHAVAETEANVVLKIRSTLFLLTALILAITTLCVSSNFSALVLERSKEIGILKAIGAAERKIAALFLSESLILGVASAAAGYGVGLLVAWWIGRQIFPESAAAGVGCKLWRVPARRRRHSWRWRPPPHWPRRRAFGASGRP